MLDIVKEFHPTPAQRQEVRDYVNKNTKEHIHRFIFGDGVLILSENPAESIYRLGNHCRPLNLSYDDVRNYMNNQSGTYHRKYGRKRQRVDLLPYLGVATAIVVSGYIFGWTTATYLATICVAVKLCEIFIVKFNK